MIKISQNERNILVYINFAQQRESNVKRSSHRPGNARTSWSAELFKPWQR